jgi:hypothetical protein
LANLAREKNEKGTAAEQTPTTESTDVPSTVPTNNPQPETTTEPVENEVKARTKVYTEQQVKITIGEAEPLNPAPTDTMLASFDEERYNKYLFDASGPKQRNILDTPVDETDAVIQDLTSFYDDGAYSVKGKGEKFALTKQAQH